MYRNILCDAGNFDELWNLVPEDEVVTIQVGNFMQPGFLNSTDKFLFHPMFFPDRRSCNKSGW